MDDPSFSLQVTRYKTVSMLLIVVIIISWDMLDAHAANNKEDYSGLAGGIMSR